MASETSLKKEVERELGKRPVTIPTPWVPQHGKLTPGFVHRGVLHTCYVFLRLDGKGAHFAKATQWSQMRMTPNPNPEMWFLQLLLLLCESHWFGSARPLADPRYDAQGYQLAVQLQARVLSNTASAADIALLKKLVRSDEYHDEQFDYRVRCEVLANQIRAQEEARAAQQQERAAAAAAANGGDNGGEPPAKRGRGKRRAPAPPALDMPVQVVAALAGVERFPSDLYGDVWDPTDVAQRARRYEYVMRNEVPRYRNAIAVAVQAGVVAAAGDTPELEERIRREIAAKLGPAPSNEERLVPKIEFTYTYVPSETGGGILARFMIHDPHMDPGLFFELHVLGDIRERAAAQMQAAASNSNGNKQTRERFPHYRPLYDRSNHPISNRTNAQTYFNMMTAMCPDYVNGFAMREQAFRNMAMQQSQHATHPYQVCSLERALRTMVDVKCSPAMCDGKLWKNPDGCPAVPNLPELTTYAYVPQQVFWRNFHYIGLMEQFLPHVDADSDFLAAIMAGEDLSRYLPPKPNGGDAVAIVQPVRSSVNNMYANNWLISREAVLGQTLLSYHTNNEFMHLAARAAILNKRMAQEYPADIVKTHKEILRLGAEKWRSVPALVDSVTRYERYCALVQKVQDCNFQSFSPLWPLEGEVNDVPVPASIRALHCWYRDNNTSKLPHMTREYTIYDRDLGLFGNSMFLGLKIFSIIGRIVHPSICLLSEGLLSCYRYAPRELFFNIMAHGRYDVGKTFILITTLLELVTIRETVEEYTSESNAASTTQKHTYDMIIASDEVMPWKVDEQEAKKNPVLVNQEKVKLVTQKVGKKIFTFVKTEDGQKHRWTCTVISDHYSALVEVTNFEIEQKNALSSRYHTLTVPLPRIPVRELKGHMSALLKDDARIYFHINQYLSACLYKSIQCGVQMEPNMDLFHDMNNRVLNYLVNERVVSQDVGARGLEVMKPYAIQLVVHMAHRYAFDMPWSPNYKKKFEVKHIREEQRYLYCSTEIVWWCWTALACEWISGINADVIEAAVASLGVNWLPATSAYTMYENDLDDRIPWRRHTNTRRRADPRDGNDHLIDLNYITFKGSVDDVAARIAASSKNKLSYIDVKGALNSLSARWIQIPGGAYTLQEEAVFKRYHRFIDPPTEDNGQRGTKVNGSTDGSVQIPPIYTRKNSDTKQDRTENDVIRRDASEQLAPVDLTEKGYVHIMPCVAHLFRADVIKDALIYATVCKTMRAGKYLLGMPADDNSMRLQVQDLNEHVLAEFVTGFDKEEHIVDGVWNDPKCPNKPLDEIPISRTMGIGFSRRGGISGQDALVFQHAPMAPVANDKRAQWNASMKADLAEMSDVVETITDLDYHSARAQHLRCGLPIDEPVHDPRWIRERFDASATPECYANMHYPEDWQPEDERRKRIFDAISDTSRAAAFIAKRRQAQAPPPAPPQPQPQSDRVTVAPTTAGPHRDTEDQRAQKRAATAASRRLNALIIDDDE